MGSIVRSPKDFWLGVIYVLVGAVGFLLARDYPFGTGARMGPGYLPTIVSSLLLIFGAVSIGRSFVLSGEAIGVIAWKALPLIVGSAAAFAFLIDGAGFIAASFSLLLLCAVASDKFRWSGTALLGAAALVAICTLVFVKGLGIPMPAVGPWLQAISPIGLGS